MMMVKTRHFLTIVLFILSAISGLFAVEYLPDAAGHLGTLIINNDEQFTANPSLTLTIHAVDPTVSQMQFSTDGLTWTAPESYQPTKNYQLQVQNSDYPVKAATVMDTVQKTIYVRFKDGSGNWTKAVTDSIVFARGVEFIPQVIDVYIAQELPPPMEYDSTQPLGSRKNPHIVPPTNNEAQFDAVMHAYTMVAYTTDLAYRARYDNYWRMPNLTHTYTFHIGPGVYETQGAGPYSRGGGENNWAPWDGWRIIGSGKDATRLLLVDRGNPGWAVIASMTGYSAYVADFEIKDITLDANMNEPGGTPNSRSRVGSSIVGNNIQMRRVRAQNFGTKTFENCGICGMSFGTTANEDDWNYIIEDCEVVAPQWPNNYAPPMISLGGEPNGPLMRYQRNTVIRNNYVNGSVYSGQTPLDSTQLPMTARGTHGVCLEGAKDSVIEDNLIVHTMTGYYTDDLNDTFGLVIRNNHYKDVIGGFWLKAESKGSITFENNLVELDPFYYTAKEPNGNGDYEWRGGISTGRDSAYIPYQYGDNEIIVRGNTFQWTDRVQHDPKLYAGFGSSRSFHHLRLENNILNGFERPYFLWFNDPEYLEKQADLADASRPVPVFSNNNLNDDGTVAETYPFVLDKTLTPVVVTEGDTANIPVPNIGGTKASIAYGLPIPTGSPTPLGSNITWTTKQGDAGRYVVSFYADADHKKDPRRTMVIVKSPATAADPNYFNTGLKAYWKFDEISGTGFEDSSGNGNTIDSTWGLKDGWITMGATGHTPDQRGILFNPRTTTGGPTMAFSNLNEKVMESFPVGYHPTLRKPTRYFQSFTISMWFNVSQKPKPGDGNILMTYGAQMYGGIFPSANAGNPNVHIGFHPWTNGDFNFDTPDDITVGRWHQAVLTYDGLSSVVYVDGKKKAEDIFGVLVDFWVDGALGFGGGDSSTPFAGGIDDIAVWNRPLSSEEVAQLFKDQGGVESQDNSSGSASVSSAEFLTFQNIFNPTKENITLKYDLKKSGNATLIVYDHSGNKVRTLEGDNSEAVWDGRNAAGKTVASGVYIVLLKTGNQTAQTKVVAVK